MAATGLNRVSLSSQLNLTSGNNNNNRKFIYNPLLRYPHFTKPNHIRRNFSSSIIKSKAVEIGSQSKLLPTSINGGFRPDPSSLLLDVTGMMCGSCVSRVKSILSNDDRIESVVVNILTETTGLRLKPGVLVEHGVVVGEELALRLTECGFPSKRWNLGLGIGENVKKWKDMNKKKDEMIMKSRNRVVFAWTLVALCFFDR